MRILWGFQPLSINGNKRSGKMEVTTLWVGKYPLPGFDALMVMPE
jgi:hypothetical protein